MGRRSWATVDQLFYLKSFVHLLQRAKETTTLKTLYRQVYDGFLQHWAPEPVIPLPDVLESPEQLVGRAKERLYRVSIIPRSPVCMLTVWQRIVFWYKEQRKKQKYSTISHAAPAKSVLDLSGRSRRRKPPYQLHQAYLILHWRPKDSPLRREVEDLWLKQDEESVRKILRPFIKESVNEATSTSQKLVFHMAVMCWKCSLLNPEELAKLQGWIKENRKLKNKAQLPWSDEANEYSDKLFAENTFIQRCVFPPPQNYHRV